MSKTSLDKSKIKFLLLEGVHQNALDVLNANGYTNRTGISERSARRIEQASSLPSQRPKRSWRTREDPLGLVWDSEVVPLLKSDVHLNAVTLLEELQRRQLVLGRLRRRPLLGCLLCLSKRQLCCLVSLE